MYLIFYVFFAKVWFSAGADKGLTPIPCHSSCSLVKDCQEAWNLVNREDGRTSEHIDYLRKAFCGFEDGEAKICCEVIQTATHRNLNLLPKNCGPYDGDRVVGGTVAAIKEFPWMGLISIKTRDGKGFVCGATAISDRYVLTAAHCVKNKEVAGVRIGEHDLDSPQDCEGKHGVVCADPVQDILVDKIIIHNNYTNNGQIWKHDIALLRLRKQINFDSNNAKPICLPTSPEEQGRNLDGLRAVTPGWGVTEKGTESNLLMKVEIPVMSKDECSFYYEGNKVPTRFRTNTNTFLCAGVAGKDSCRRDSGGPLLITGEHGGFTRFIQYGIVSFGLNKCAADRPSLYTDISMHMPWILDNLEP